MRPDLAPHEQLLLQGAFTADDMSDLVRSDDTRTGALRSEAETDYALARFVAANCAVAGEFLDAPTPFVLKGGLAVYSCYQGKRRSRDADVSPSSLDIEIEGLEPPDLLRIPDGMPSSIPPR